MNTDTLRRLADRADGVEGRQADRLTEVHSRIRTARRRRTAVGAVAAAGLAIAVVSGGAVLSGSLDRSDGPMPQKPPKPKPTETESPQPEPAGQTVVQAEIGPGDIQGWKLMGSRTNTQAGFEGATDLALTAQVGGLYGSQSFVEPFCTGDAGTWWVLTMDLGGVDGEQNADGSMGNGTRGQSGPCAEDGPTAVPAPGNHPIDGRQRDEAAEPYPLRMFVTSALSADAQDCLSGTTDTDSCLAAHDIAPLSDSDATFGFGVYEHRSGPTVLQILDGWMFQALAIGDGVQYLVDRAVVAAPDAAQLVVQLPASDHRRVVAVYESETPALEKCADRIDIEVVDPASERAQSKAFERRCRAVLELRVDGQLPSSNEDFDAYFGEQQVVLPPGEAREVTVDVVKNDPANVRYALVIWEERS